MLTSPLKAGVESFPRMLFILNISQEMDNVFFFINNVVNKEVKVLYVFTSQYGLQPTFQQLET